MGSPPKSETSQPGLAAPPSDEMSPIWPVDLSNARNLAFHKTILPQGGKLFKHTSMKKKVPTIRRIRLVLLVLTAASAIFAADMALERHGALAAQFETDEITVVTVRGRFQFSVEIAKTDRQRGQGLQYRTELKADAGMLFDFGRVQKVVMWMKNTFIPLDMIFISEDGRVDGVAENTTPQSLELIQSGNPVLSVLEVRAGTAARLGITKGSRILHPVFGTKPKAGRGSGN